MNLLKSAFKYLKDNKLFSTFLILLISTSLIFIIKLLPNMFGKVINGNFVITVLNFILLIIALVSYIIFTIKYIIINSREFLPIIIIGLITVVYLYAIGWLALSVSKNFFPDKYSEMLSFYGSIFSAVISSVIGVAGAIIGAKVGAKESYKAAMDAVTAQIQHDKEQIKLEKEENNKIASQIIKHFVYYEIRENFNILKGSNGLFIERLKMFHPMQCSIPNTALRFEEFNKIKYDLFKYNTKAVNEVLDIYEIFMILKEHCDVEQLTQKEFDKIKNIFFKYWSNYKEP